MAAHVTLFSSDDNAEFTVHEHLACAERHPASAVVDGYACEHDEGKRRVRVPLASRVAP